MGHEMWKRQGKKDEGVGRVKGQGKIKSQGRMMGQGDVKNHRRMKGKEG